MAVPPIHIGWEPREAAVAPGRAGNAALDDAAGPRLLLPPTEMTAEPAEDVLPLRVLFLSLRTRVECFDWLATCPWSVTGLAAAAEAQPVDSVVAPCIPPRPGRDG